MNYGRVLDLKSKTISRVKKSEKQRTSRFRQCSWSEQSQTDLLVKVGWNPFTSHQNLDVPRPAGLISEDSIMSAKARIVNGPSLHTFPLVIYGVSPQT